MHVGLQMVHRQRLRDGEDLTWPEVEAQETEDLREEVRRSFGMA